MREWAQTVIDGFDAVDLATNDEIAAAGGPSTTTVSKYRMLAAGKLSVISEPRTDVFRKIDRAAQWEPGGARMLWRYGTTPVRVNPELQEIIQADPEVTAMTAEKHARLTAIARRYATQLMREAAREAAAIADEDPAKADRIIDDAMTVTDMLRVTIELAGKGVTTLSVVPDTTEDPIAAHEDGDIGGEQVDRHDT